MSFSTGVCACALTLLLSIATACTKKPESGARRIGILPFENLTSDTSLDWIGLALAGVVAGETIGSADMLPIEMRSIRDAAGSRATHVLQGYFTRRGDGISVKAVLMDQQTRKAASTLTVDASPDRVLAAAETIAKHVTADVHPYGTASEQAVQQYYRALAATQQEQRQYLQNAIAADPRFGSAHLTLVQSYLAAGDRDKALAALNIAAAHSAGFQPLARARLDLIRASLAGDRARQTSALGEVARAAKADVDAWRNLAEVELINKNFTDAVQAYEQAAELEPSNVATWNSLGYARAYAGNLDGAVEALERYRKLAPEDANALDSLGDIHFYLGRFGEAEKYYLEAHQKNSALLGGGDLYRAAFARLMTGDLQQADKHFAGYLQLRQSLGDALAPVRQAIWWWTTGRRREAVASLEKLTGAQDVAAIAKTQLAIWSLDSGQLEQGRLLSAAAVGMAQSPAAKTLALVTAAAASGQVNPRAPENVTGYTLLVTRRFPDAERVWRKVYDNTSANTALESRVMLAWALLEAGKTSEAAPLLQGWPLPAMGAEPGFSTFLFPRYLELRARADRGETAKLAANLYGRLTSPNAR